MVRSPVVLGQFYESDPDLLRQQIISCFLHELGAGLPAGRSHNVRAVISPHAGYLFSGPCQSHSFRLVAESPKPAFYLLIGPSHSGSATCFSDENWLTPFGVARVDKAVKMLSREAGIPIINKNHLGEHSIEVQLPFLQFVKKSFTFVPLMVSHDVDIHSLARSLKRLLPDDVCIIVSSDFTHYGASYAYLPFSSDRKANMYSLDRSAIDLVLEKKSGRFMDFVEEKRQTICGYLPIALLLDLLGIEKGTLLKYYTSGDIVGDYSSAVGYAAVAFS